MISILLPTRRRPQIVNRCVESILDTVSCAENVEILVGIDSDDRDAYSLEGFSRVFRVTLQPSPFVVERFNELYKNSSGDVVMYCGDDAIFATENWDQIVQSKFDLVDDKILLVYPPDLQDGDKAAPFGFVSRRSVEIVGAFMPSGFYVWFGDTWLYEVYRSLGRLCCVFEIDIIHRHPKFFAEVPIDEGYLDSHFNPQGEKISADKVRWELTSEIRSQWISLLREKIQ